LAIRPFALPELPPDLNRHAGVSGKEIVMHLLLPLPLGLFDPHLQLEAEQVDAALRWPSRRAVGIHAQISQAITAIDQLSVQLQRAELERKATTRH
jgi:hypothetical protein